MANIIQAEFFHVGGAGKIESLEDFVSGCLERATEGSRLKTVVRFYDDDSGRITAQVKHYNEMEKVHEGLVRLVIRSGGLWRWFLDISARRVAGKKRKAGEVHKRLVLNRMREIAQDPQSVAVEKRDHHFRFVREDEKHEILEAVGRGKSLWIFVFEPNDLLADSNKIVASAM